MPEMRAVRFHTTGGPDVLSLDEIPVPDPGPGEVRVALRFAGVNFIDTYLRAGLYPAGELPAIAGKEGAGEVDVVGAGVDHVRPGDRVAFTDAGGTYAEFVVHRADRLMPVPEQLDLTQAAALALQGMTAHYLTSTIRPLAPGDRVLVHAAAGGVGHLAVQLAKLAGAEVFGTVSTEEKAERAESLGVDHVIRYDQVDFADEVLELTDSEGVDLAIDGIGRATFESSVRATRLRGHVILFGQASGEPDPIRPRRLLGSRTLTTASLFDYTRSDEELAARAATVFRLAADGRLTASVDTVLPLADARIAHERLEGRQTTGKVLLDVARS